MFTNTVNVTVNTANANFKINSLPTTNNPLQNSGIVLSNGQSLVRGVVPNASFSDIYMSSSAPSLDPSSKLALSILAEAVSDVSITRSTPKGFDSISEFQGIEYVGYIIDKQRLNRKTGEWHTIDEYKIIGIETNSFIDTRVAYGEIYRYKIRSVLRFTQKEIITEITQDNSSQNIDTIILRRLQDKMASMTLLFQRNFQIANRGLSNPNSRNNIIAERVNIFGSYYATFSADRIDVFQDVSELDSSNLRTEKNSRITSLGFLSKKFNVYLPIPNQNIVTQKVIYKSYYYESLPSLEWKYVDVFEDDAPPAPQSIKISPNTLSNQIIVSWLRPSDSARDIAAYRLYRRRAFGQSWQLLKQIQELDVNDDGIPDTTVKNNNSANLYIDKNVDTNSSYIYALSCVDIHGIESFLSAQIQAQLNPNFAFEKEEKPLKWISGGGATPQELDFVYKKFLSRNEAIIAKSKAKITVNSKFKDTTKSFIIRVTSLDTHEKRDYKLVINNKKVTPVSYGNKGTAGIIGNGKW